MPNPRSLPAIPCPARPCVPGPNNRNVARWQSPFANHPKKWVGEVLADSGADGKRVLDRGVDVRRPCHVLEFFMNQEGRLFDETRNSAVAGALGNLDEVIQLRHARPQSLGAPRTSRRKTARPDSPRRASLRAFVKALRPWRNSSKSAPNPWHQGIYSCHQGISRVKGWPPADASPDEEIGALLTSSLI